MKLAVLVTILGLDDKKKNNKWLLVDWEIPYLRAPVCYTIYLSLLFAPFFSSARNKVSKIDQISRHTRVTERVLTFSCS